MDKSKIIIDCLCCASNKLIANRSYLDEINVFPVKDADTGSNMARTMKAVADAVKRDDSGDCLCVLKKASKAAVRNARGNSGVILSVLLKGFCDCFLFEKTFESENLDYAFKNALSKATQVLSEPIFDGTILSVAAAAEKGAQKAKGKSFADSFKLIEAECKKAADETRFAFSHLKKEPTADSGALGLYFVILAVSEALCTKEKTQNKGETDKTYCTEFIINTQSESEKDALETKLKDLGSSLAVVFDEDIIKVHIHTDYPDRALRYALKLGQLSDIKIENMALLN